jgi:hypothetical protein
LIALAIHPAVGAVIIVLTLLITIALFSGRPSDAEIDAQAGEFIKNIKAEALKKLALDEEQAGIADPIFFWSYDYGKPMFTDPNIGGLQDKRGGDSRWRSPHVAVTAFFFTESSINYYCKYSSLVSDASSVKTDEFFYKHVAGVSSDTQEYKKEDGTIIHGNVVVLKSAGERFLCSAPDAETAERTQTALKSLLRNKNA